MIVWNLSNLASTFFLYFVITGCLLEESIDGSLYTFLELLDVMIL